MGVNSSWQSEQQAPLATDTDHQPRSPLFIPDFHWLLPLSTHSCCHPSIQKLKASLSSCFLLLFAHSRCLMEALKIEVNSKKHLLFVVNNVDNRTWPRPLLCGHLHSPLARFTLTLTPHSHLPPCVCCSL